MPNEEQAMAPALQAEDLDIPGVSLEDVPDDYGRWLIHGPQGSGKTSLAATIAALGPTLLIDLIGERGVRSFKGAPGAENIEVMRPDSITALDDLFWQLAAGKHKFNAVILDSLTAVQKMTMRFMLGHDETAVREIRKGAAPADQRTWGQSLDVMIDTATFWYGLADASRERPMHVIMTAQTKMIDDESTGEQHLVPDVQKGALSMTLAAPDYVLYTDLIENPDYLADPENEPEELHVVRFGNNRRYRTKARVPYALRGRIPAVLGKKSPISLVDLSRVLGIAGVPQKKKESASG